MSGEVSRINEGFFELFFAWKKYGLDKPSYLLYNQVQSMSRLRLVRKINNYFYKKHKYIPLISDEEIQEIEEIYASRIIKKNPELQ